MDVIESVLHRLLNNDNNQTEDRAHFITQAKTTLRRTLRHPHIRENPNCFPPEALALCIIAHHHSNESLGTIHSLFLAESAASSLSLTFLRRVFEHAWLRVLPELKISPKEARAQPSDCDLKVPVDLNMPQTPKTLRISNNCKISNISDTLQTPPSSPTPKTPATCETSATPKTPHPTALFDSFEVILVPSPLFSQRSATLLKSRIQEHGGKARLAVASGETGLRQECQQAPAEGAESASGNSLVVVVADQSLIKRTSSDITSTDVRPPKWLTDSLRAKRLKSRTLYACSPLPIRQSFCKGDDTDVMTPSSSKKRMAGNAFAQTDFRTGINIPFVTPSSAKRRDVGNYARDGESGSIMEAARTPVTVATRLFASPDESITLKSSVVTTSDPVPGTKEPQQKVVSADDTPKNARGPGRNDIVVSPKRLLRSQNWACEVRVGKNATFTDFPMNDRVCELLGIVQEAHAVRKDNFRTLGYQRAIARIRTLDFELESREDVRRLREVANIGERISSKVDEIVTTGHLQQAEAVLKNADYQAVCALCGVWGIGPVKALSLVASGVRGIEDLRAAVKEDSTILDRCQTIGMRHYEDLLERIPRAHVAELELYVRRVVKSVDSNLDITIAGSYLRGKQSCGDVDILIHGDERCVNRGFMKIWQVMKKNGVITDDLVYGDGKYFGVFRLPGRKHGRIDLFAVPIQQFPFALLTYTGSAVFNRFVFFCVCVVSPSLRRHMYIFD